ncbi:MAG: holo-ACP synthase [Firmicutes bacterium]|nr:holo-ACP synthase [Alicyclobacillaceae bacterium]MCL6497476.1 holo-ACP synthase [Bacillota bacterium]
MAVLGIGVDLVEVARWEQALHRRPRLIGRLFTAEEVAEAGTGPTRGQRLAVRFAAKEAVVKACGGWHGGRWRDVAIRRSGEGPPRVEVCGPLGAWLRQAGAEVWVSLSHQRAWVVAVAVVEAVAKEDDRP